MCRIFSGLAPEVYAPQTRSVRLGGHATSIRLEAPFWSLLEEVASGQGLSLGRFLSKLHDEVLQFHGEAQNFASLLRCACLTYLAEVKHRPAVQDGLRREVARDGAFAGALDRGVPALALHDARN